MTTTKTIVDVQNLKLNKKEVYDRDRDELS